MIYFSVPADFKLSTLERLHDLNEKYNDCCVKEVYGQITIGDIQSSGRLTEVLPQVDGRQLEHYVKQAEKYGIDFNYTLNPSCYGNCEFSQSGIKQVNELLKYIWDMGIKNLTIALPSLIEITNATGLNFNIKASTICEINSPSKAKFYKSLGVKRLVVDSDIVRDFEKLSDICKTFGEGVEVIANNLCRINCTYKMFHYNHEAHCNPSSTQTIIDYYANRCLVEKTKDIESCIKMSWIRPEDIRLYESCGIKNFKIQGRQRIESTDLIKTIQTYFERSYDGNLYDLLTLFSIYNIYQVYIDNKKLDKFLDKFYENPHFCNELCDECGYCRRYTQNCIDIKKAEKIKSMYKRTFGMHDKFTQLLLDKNLIR